MSDELKPGVDRPRGWQYAAGVVVILALAALTYWLPARHLTVPPDEVTRRTGVPSRFATRALPRLRIRSRMKLPRPPAAELPILLFENQQRWAAWLSEHHTSSPGVWLQLAKKSAPLRSVSYVDALDEALCHGWIDSQKRAYDASSWLQKFTPRGPKSIWSKVNRDKVQALLAAGRMQPAGLDAVERATADGRWAAAYDSPRSATVPDDLAAALDCNPAAQAFFSALDGANQYAVLFRVQTAKTPEARAKRIAALVEMLERHERIHP